MLSASRAARSALLAASLLLVAGTSLAAGIEGLQINAGVVGNPLMQMTITDVLLQQRIDAGDLTLSQSGDQITLSGSTTLLMGAWSFELQSISFDPDPFVSFVGGLTNLLGVAQDFFVTTIVPIAPPVVPSSLMGGSTTLSYGDANFSATGGLTNVTGGASGYAGLIDGLEALSMLNAFNLTPAFAGQTTSVSETQGLPGPTLPGPAGNVSIGITNRSNLSSLDQATWNSTFIIEAVPEPGTALLLGMGLIVLAVRRR
jgi:hypothetical protein